MRWNFPRVFVLVSSRAEFTVLRLFHVLLFVYLLLSGVTLVGRYICHPLTYPPPSALLSFDAVRAVRFSELYVFFLVTGTGGSDARRWYGGSRHRLIQASMN
jgi:hypothetical protein